VSAVVSPPPSPTGRILALDTATPQTVVVLGEVHAKSPAATFFHVAQPGEAPASERVSEWVEAALTEVNWPASSVTALVVGRGPGTFTGARVGVGTAKGLALGLGLGLHPVSTLAAVAAHAAAGDTGGPLVDGDEVLAILDARKGEVYAGRFAWRGQGLSPAGPECVGSPEAVWASAFSDRLAAVVGTGLEPHRASFDALAGDRREQMRWVPTSGVTADGLWSVACVAAREPAVNASALDVTYLRQSYAELGIHPPKRKYEPSPFV